MRPMNRAANDRACSTSRARTVPRVSLVAPRRSAVTSCGSSDRQVLHDQNKGRPEDDHEQRREDAPDEREQHLDRRLGSLFLGALPALDAELLRLDLEHLRDRNTELLGLDDRADEVRERLDFGPWDDVAERLATRLAHAHLGQRAPELVDERALHLLDDLAQRGVEAKAGADGDREQVEGVRDPDQDGLLPRLDSPAEPELRAQVADAGADEAQEQTLDDLAREKTEEDEEQAEPDAGDDRLDAQPVGDLHVAGIAGHRQALLRALGERARRDPRDGAGEASRERLDGAVEERLLELQLLEILRRHLAEL